ncbi:glycerate kinase [Spirillospora sp. NPDC049652]
MRGHVVIAPDKFKGTLTAAEAAGHIAAGLRRVRPGLAHTLLPVADGGDGTVEAAVAAGFSQVKAVVTGPAGEPVVASYAVRGTTAVIELAEASGLRRLPGGRPAPLTATSRGTGELVDAALAGGARRIVLGLGGSACTDGGAGMAAALGVRFLDAAGAELPPGGAALRRLVSIDVAGLPARLADVEVVVASDVDSPLLGRDGAAEVFAPQKGASPTQVRALELGLTRLASVIALAAADGAAPDSRAPDPRAAGAAVARAAGAGAAGGVGFGAMVFLGATVRPGIGYLLDLLGFAEAVRGARLVVTGEGSLDPQSLRGKAPVGVAEAAAREGVATVAVAGRRALTGEQLRKAGLRDAFALTDIEPDPLRCMAEAGPLLERLTAERVAPAWLPDA